MSSGWSSLIVITQEALLSRQQSYGTECPNDGVVLRQGPHGELYCPFDGWRGDRAAAMPTGPRAPAAVGAGYGVSGYGVSGYGV